MRRVIPSRVLGALFLIVVAVAPGLSHAKEEYGEAGGFEVLFNDVACVAGMKASVNITINGHADKGYFFLLAQKLGPNKVVGFAISSGSIHLQPKAWMEGKLQIGDISLPTVFLAENEHTFTGYVPLEWAWRLRGGEIVSFLPPGGQVDVPIKGIEEASGLLHQCADKHIK